ncbi:alpha/beta hydrolase [Deferribacter autotrophicus]|uniref:Alpha/beta hydrolase n=1 Tax=Deferribacter autotrophicus TaxID=500465 RepID=A0A5A8F2Y8_9BACT|nr:alpha/beta hydrolase [Deferribacter autotrophicus]KAA0258367.1 alpha/beta hydrolase [Deferribacter autotrophicus]
MKLVVFSHGKEGTPDGIKIKKLSNVAIERGWNVISIDYQGIYDPEKRVKKLLNYIPENYKKIVLVGSSMGGYISLVAGKKIKPDGIFLLAPAVMIENEIYCEKEPFVEKSLIEVVHGYKDSIISVDKIFNYCKKYSIPLHLVDDEHRLLRCIDEIVKIFENFLIKVDSI